VRKRSGSRHRTNRSECVIWFGARSTLVGPDSMASPLNAAVCAVVALLFWTALGFSISRRIFPRALALPIAPALGWAVYSAATLPIFLLFGFSVIGVMALAAVAVIGSAALSSRRFDREDRATRDTVPNWAYLAAAVLALAPAAAVVPEHVGDGVVFAEPIFDHAKLPIIDAMTRLGLPPANPFFGEFDEPGRLAYYYLWYFSAAQFAMVLGLTGWEADIALTWLSAFSSLTLMMGLASWFSGRPSAAVWALLFAASGSLRFVLGALLGAQWLDGMLAYPTGFAGWLFQAAWVPQHLMSAACVVIAILLISRLSQQRSILPFATLVLVVVAGFESSTWVGGITFLLSALIVCPILLRQVEPHDRRRFILSLAGAAALSVALAAPLLLDQVAAAGLRSSGSPIVIHHFDVLGRFFQEPLRRILDFPAYWLVLLVVEFPATYVAGSIALVTFLTSHKLEPERQRAAAAFAALASTSLAVSWLLVSTLADNNDLGLRAVLPGAMILIVFSAAGLSIWLQQGPRAASYVALGGLLLGFPDAAQITYGNVIGRPAQPGKAFAQTPEMWEAVRRHSAPGERVGNNPLFLADMTPWPVNLSWALLSNRSSCFAGRELTLVYASLTPRRLAEIDAQFIRVFNGNGSESDIRELAMRFGCRVIVVTVEDGAWQRDPFAASELYRLVETAPDRWRIYRSILPADARTAPPISR
jgi:hypothetical protein